MARVVLVNLPFQEDIEAVAQTSVGPPMGQAYVASVLLDRGHDVHMIDANALRLQLPVIMKKLASLSPDVVGTTAATPSLVLATEFAKGVKRLGDIPVILGGPHGSALPEETLLANPEIDVVVVGEGESIADRLVHALTGSGSVGDVPSIAFRKDGAVVQTPLAPLQEELDAIPFPARHLLPNHLYRTIDSWPMTCIIAVRGCPARCIYCNVPHLAGRGMRRRSDANIVAEMELCLSRWGVSFFSFIDDTFTTSRAWVHGLCDAIISAGLARKVRWSCLTRPDMADEELLGKMKQAGCVRVEFGIESGSPRMLEFLRKGACLEDIRKAFSAAKEVGLVTLGFAMVNIPGETREDMQMTLDEVLAIDPTFLQLSFCTPYPGTYLHEYCRENGLLETDDWARYRFLREPVIRNPHMTGAQIQAWHSQILRRFYFRPKKFLHIGRHALLSPNTFYSLSRSCLQGAGHLVRVRLGRGKRA